MREGIHPNYVEATVTCACGHSFQTRSTKSVIRLDICSSCHPFFTGRQKFVDTAGRVERFQKRFAKTGGETVSKTPKQPKLAKGQQTGMPKKAPVKVLSTAPLKTAKPAPGAKAPKPAGDKKPAKAH